MLQRKETFMYSEVKRIAAEGLVKVSQLQTLSFLK